MAACCLQSSSRRPTPKSQEEPTFFRISDILVHLVLATAGEMFVFTRILICPITFKNVVIAATWERDIFAFLLLIVIL